MDGIVRGMGEEASLLKQNPAELSIAKKRKKAALAPDFLAETLTGAVKTEKI